MIYTNKAIPSEIVEAMQFDGTQESADEILRFIRQDRSAHFANGSGIDVRDHSGVKYFFPLFRLSKKFRIKELEYKREQKLIKQGSKNTLLINTTPMTLWLTAGDYITHDGTDLHTYKEEKFLETYTS